MQSKNIEIRRISGNEIAQAIDLSWEVFLQFEAPEYSDEGVRTFRESLDDKERAASLDWFGAFEDGRLVGTISVREPCHLGGFFVKADCHGKGYGRMLFEAVKREYPNRAITVNSSPYAVPIYEHLGFRATDSEQTVTGVRFTPMIFGE